MTMSVNSGLLQQSNGCMSFEEDKVSW